MSTTSKLGADMLTDEQLIEIASRYAHSDGWLNGDGALNFARALLARQPAAIDKEAVTTYCPGQFGKQPHTFNHQKCGYCGVAAPLANEASKPAPSVERMTVSQAPNSQYAIGWNACLDAIGAAPSVDQDETEALRAIIDEVHEWAVCACIASPEDMAQNFPRIVEITSPDYRAASTSANVAQGAEPYGYAPVNPNGNYFTRNKSTADYVGGMMPVYAAPPAQTALTDDARDAARWRIVEQTIPADDLHDIAVIVAHESGAFVGNAFLRTPADLIDAALTAAQSASGDTK